MKDNIIKNNTMIGAAESIKLGSADRTKFISNTFLDAVKVRFRDSTWTLMLGNIGLEGVKLSVTDGACFDYGCDAGFEPIC